jgi:hypothetical protein
MNLDQTNGRKYEKFTNAWKLNNTLNSQQVKEKKISRKIRKYFGIKLKPNIPKPIGYS